MHSLADLWRLRLRPETKIHIEVDTPGEEYLLYRVFLAPVEVAHYWYAYYADDTRREGWQAILPWRTTLDLVHPARKVGLWAYRSRFPEQYAATINAYASADADAYAHFGMPGVIGAAMLVLAFRVLLASWGRGSDLRRAISGSAIMLLALLLPQASVQAIFVAQGLLFYPGALWVAKRLE